MPHLVQVEKKIDLAMENEWKLWYTDRWIRTNFESIKWSPFCDDLCGKFHKMNRFLHLHQVKLLGRFKLKVARNRWVFYAWNIMPCVFWPLLHGLKMRISSTFSELTLAYLVYLLALPKRNLTSIIAQLHINSHGSCTFGSPKSTLFLKAYLAIHK